MGILAAVLIGLLVYVLTGSALITLVVVIVLLLLAGPTWGYGWGRRGGAPPP
jgi:hypothetical protein